MMTLASLVLLGSLSLPQDPVGYWSFDEGTGTSVLDLSGHNAKGTLVGKAQWADGKLGKAVYFPGTPGSCVDIPDGDWNRGGPATVMLWVKNGFDNPEHPPAVLLSHLEGGQSGMFSLTLTGGNYMGFAVWDAQFLERQKRNESPERGVSEVMHDPDWIHLAFTVGEKELKLYKNGALKQVREIASMPVSRGRLYIGARGPQEDLPFKGWIDDVAVFDRALSEAEIQKIYSAAQTGVGVLGTRSAPEVVHLAADKLLYSPAEKGVVSVVVKNFSPAPQDARLSVKLRTLLQSDREIHASTVRLEPHATLVRDLPLSFAGESYGCTLTASLECDGRRSARESQPFSVSDNLWKVAIGGTFHPAVLGLMQPREIPRALDQMQSTYANYSEIYFWAPDDWGDMNPKTEWWYGGQAGYFMQKANLKEWIRQSHARGLKVTTYGKSTCASGPPGAEISRRRPEWFRRTGAGSLLDEGGNAGDFDRWNDREYREKGGKFATLYAVLSIDNQKEEPSAFGNRQIVQSIREFGWDGIRFDDIPYKNAELGALRARQRKELVWRDAPGFAFGYNASWSPESMGGLNHELRECMAGGGCYFQEAIRDFGRTPSLRYESWRAYAVGELKSAKMVQAAGGTYHGLYLFGYANPARDLYKLIFSLVAGGHVAGGTHEKVPG
ncbi:MAG TPA: LamG-like jellyroll fold domain-containing protein, partial [Planctomycetota bacterium]|nr:LamG-like jellyroll fold domain-containing protein [Planctomycetota bacterium]